MGDVYKRTEYDSPGKRISSNLYNAIIGLVLCWGFLLNWVMVKAIPIELLYKIPYFVIIIGFLASSFFGVFLFSKSSNPIVSFIGYNFVVFPFGISINFAVASYSPELVANAIRVTGSVTFLMMVLGTIFPIFFKKIIGALSIALIAVIIIELIEVIFFNTHNGILDWITAIIFCGYIGYDWGRANSIPRTIDNAVDSAAELYIDIINLFLSILRIMGNSDD